MKYSHYRLYSCSAEVEGKFCVPRLEGGRHALAFGLIQCQACADRVIRHPGFTPQAFSQQDGELESELRRESTFWINKRRLGLDLTCGRVCCGLSTHIRESSR